MSRYKRKYVSKRVAARLSNKIYRFDRAYATAEAVQQTSDNIDTPDFATMTEWGQYLSALSIYDFNQVAPTLDVQSANSAITAGIRTSFNSTTLQGLSGEFSIDADLSNKAVGSISNLKFGRTMDRTFVLVANIPLTGIPISANDYIGGPGNPGDSNAFFQSAYNSSNNGVIISPTTVTGVSVAHQNWIRVGEGGKLSLTMIRWNNSTGKYSVRYQLKQGVAKNSGITISAGTNTAGTFYFGALGGASTSTINTKFYWTGFFNDYLSDDDFDVASRVLGL